MSIVEGKDYLYLIWKCETTRRQYIVGQLTKNGQYEFEYCKEIEDAKKVGFFPLVSFEETDRVYKSEELFPVFSSRLPDRKRKDISKILDKYGLQEYDAYQLLKRSGAKLPIDNLQFIDPILNFESDFEKKIWLAGVRHYLGCNGNECSIAIDVSKEERVFLRREVDNKHDENAIQVINEQGGLLGYIPRYYNSAYVRLMKEKTQIECYVTNVNKNKCCDECIAIMTKVTYL